MEWQHYDSFTKKLKRLGKPVLDLYHQTTKYRMKVAEQALKLMLDNYDNGHVFAVGLTGFLVQAKASLDSLSQEINLLYTINVRTNWAFSVEELTEMNNLEKLRKHNSKLASFIDKELGRSSAWYKDLKDLRDQEGVHRIRTPRNLRLFLGANTQPTEINIKGNDIGPYCQQILSKVNIVTEGCYALM